MSDCVGCQRIVRLAPGELDRLLNDYLATHPGPVVDDDTYATRLSACAACPDLRYGTTCRHCGCLVTIRAKLGDKACPAPLAKW